VQGGDLGAGVLGLAQPHGGRRRSPSGLPNCHDSDGSHEMTKGEVLETIDGFVQADGIAERLDVRLPSRETVATVAPTSGVPQRLGIPGDVGSDGAGHRARAGREGETTWAGR
jgi:hypothetical protein